MLEIIFGFKKHKVDGCSARRLFTKINKKMEANKMESWFCLVLSGHREVHMLPAVMGTWSA